MSNIINNVEGSSETTTAGQITSPDGMATNTTLAVVILVSVIVIVTVIFIIIGLAIHQHRRSHVYVPGDFSSNYVNNGGKSDSE